MDLAFLLSAPDSRGLRPGEEGLEEVEIQFEPKKLEKMLKFQFQKIRSAFHQARDSDADGIPDDG